MGSDVEMEDLKIPVTDTSASKISIPVLVHSPSPAPSHPAQPQPPQPAPKPASTAKPKSTKTPKARSPSPSPPPPPPVIPLRTIRLEIPLGGPSNYEVDIGQKSKETGQRESTPLPRPKKVADSSDEDDEDDEKKDKPKRKKRKNVASEYYDTSDPFIDDSELALDERQYFAQTKQQGFYVSSGEVALLKDKTPKKPKSSKRPNLLSGLGISVPKKDPITVRKANTPRTEEGTREAPIPIDQDDSLPGAAGPSNLSSTILKPSLSYVPGTDPALVQSGLTGQKRKRSAIVTVTGENGKKKKVVDETAFHPDLQKAIVEMKSLVSQEAWEQKGKFPSTLKPALAGIALLAIRLDEYDDDFFSLMPQLFPYNKFTMTKLIKRTVFADHINLLAERQDQLLTQLKDLAQAGFAKAEEEWEKSVIAWDKRREKLRQEAATEANGPTGNNSATSTRHPTEEMDVDVPEEGVAAVKDKDGKEKEAGHAPSQGQAHPPAKRYRLTDAMKAIIWELVALSNECCRLENEKNGLEGSIIQVSEQGLRKGLYQKIVAAFPEGWMSSGNISRDVSALKKKLEKEAMEHGDD